MCHSWLGIGIGDGQIERKFNAAKGEELKDFEMIFLAKAARGFSDDHMWFSIITRPPRTNFTRCQRVSCCLSTLLCTMLANAMFYQRNNTSGSEVDIGVIQFSWTQIAIGIQSALLVLPVNLLIVTLFRKSCGSVTSPELDRLNSDVTSTKEETDEPIAYNLDLKGEKPDEFIDTPQSEPPIEQDYTCDNNDVNVIKLKRSPSTSTVEAAEILNKVNIDCEKSVSNSQSFSAIELVNDLESSSTVWSLSSCTNCDVVSDTKTTSANLNSVIINVDDENDLNCK